MSLIVTLVLLVYLTYKMNVILHKDGYQMISTVKEGFIAPRETFGTEEGFSFAVALIDWFDLQGQGIDPSIA